MIKLVRNTLLVAFHQHLFNELVTQGTFGAKALLLQSHILFGLRVEGGVFNQAVDKQPHMVLHLNGKKNVKRTQLCILLTNIFTEYTYIFIFIKKINKMNTWKGLTVTPALFFFFTTSMSLLTTWSAT